MIVVVIGVSGSGKSTIGTMLASAMYCQFLEGDALHSQHNVDKMRAGVPLTDDDREPWLAAVHDRIVDFSRRGEDLVVACSALKQRYRQTLEQGVGVEWVYLKGSVELIRSRLEDRQGHFMKADMLASQFDALEEPAGTAIVVDVSLPPEVIVAQVLRHLFARAEVRVANDLEQLSAITAAAIARVIDHAVRRAGRCSLALSGGDTPRPLYRLLGSKYRDRIPWSQVHVFWGDERYVPADHADSNYRMARETLLSQVPCPVANIHPMPTHLPTPNAAAELYERTLREYFGPNGPRFDLNLLGVGADGHTASIFPGSPALAARARWVLAVESSVTPASRLTLTLPALLESANLFVLVAGANKADAVGLALGSDAASIRSPAAALRRAHGRVIWWLDREAAGNLTREGDR
jgi:6-phosphogluconolactonase